MTEPVIPVEADLTLFRSQLNALQRRRERRYRCSLATSGKLQFEATGETVGAWVSNMSRAGAGLEMQKPLDVGRNFELVLRTTDNSIVRLPARVMHCTALANGGWRVGARFEEKISADVLESLL